MKTIKLFFLTSLIALSLTNCGTPQSKAEKAVKTDVESKALVPVKFEFGVIDTAKILFSQTKECSKLNKSLDSLTTLEADFLSKYMDIQQKSLENLITAATEDNNKFDTDVKLYEDTLKLMDKRQIEISLEKNKIKNQIKELDINTKPIDGYKLIVYETIDEPKTKLKLIYYFDKELNIIDSKIPLLENAIK